MFWIAHRGNLFGRDPCMENNPDYIKAAIEKGFDVEIDVWWKDDVYYLGYDEPQYQVDNQFFNTYILHLWCHAINASTFSHLLQDFPNIHVFRHDVDSIVLTSKAIPRAYPGQPIDSHTVCVMPEQARGKYTHKDLDDCRGICSDYVGWYKQQADATTRIGMIIGGRFNTQETNLFPQVIKYITDNPTHWIDIHISINEEPSLVIEYLNKKWMDAPFVATISCQKYKAPDNYINHPKKYCGETYTQNTMSMFYNNRIAFLQLKSYHNYDVVMKYRPDIVCETLPPISQAIEQIKTNKKCICMPRLYHYGHICGQSNDQVGIGSPEMMEIYCNTYDDIDYHLVNAPPYCLHPESMLKFHLDKNEIVIEVFDYTYHLDHNRHK